MKEETNNLKKIEKIIKDIKNVKIQGANDIAIQGIAAATLTEDKKLIKKIANARPTEPLLHNSLKIIMNSKNPILESKKIESYIQNSKKEIAKLGASIIEEDMNIFSHCHSTTVIDILKYARKNSKKNFTVYTLEVEPLLQGRKTAKELAEFGINVIIFPDLAAEEALKKCDLFLFGSDAYTKKGVVNKIGTQLLCKIAKEYKIPSYSCGISLKYTEKVKIESRSGREVWDERHKKITVVNSAFDFTKSKYISGVISELGILSHKDFIKKVKKK